jgi:hypothetical protein
MASPLDQEPAAAGFVSVAAVLTAPCRGGHRFQGPGDWKSRLQYKVHLRGLGRGGLSTGSVTRGGGFCICSCGFNRPWPGRAAISGAGRLEVAATVTLAEQSGAMPGGL